VKIAVIFANISVYLANDTKHIPSVRTELCRHHPPWLRNSSEKLLPLEKASLDEPLIVPDAHLPPRNRIPLPEVEGLIRVDVIERREHIPSIDNNAS